MKPPRVQARRRSRTPWSHSPHASGPALHAHRAPGCWLPFFRARRLVVSPDAGAVEKRHPELDPALLGQEQQPLPDTQVGPADEHLSRPRPGPQVRGDGPPLGSSLMPPVSCRQSHAARRSPRWCAADPSAASYPWADTPQPTAPSSSIAPPTALPSPHSRRGKTPVITIGASANRPITVACVFAGVRVVRRLDERAA